MKQSEIAIVKTTERLCKQALERHVKRVFGNSKPVVFIAGKAIEIDADRRDK